jgi:hypothetical protein
MGGKNAPRNLCGYKVIKCPLSFDFAQDKFTIHRPPPNNQEKSPLPFRDCVIIRFFVATHWGENRLLNFNSLRPYGRLQSQNMIVAHPLGG